MLSTKIVMLQDLNTWLPLSHDKCFLRPLVIFKDDIGSLNYSTHILTATFMMPVVVSPLTFTLQSQFMQI